MSHTVTRFTGADGREYVSVVVGRSRPFARAVLKAWQRLDGIDRIALGFLDFKAFTLPADLFDGEVVAAARAEVEAREGAS